MSLAEIKQSVNSKRAIKKFKLSPKNQTSLYIKSNFVRGGVIPEIAKQFLPKPLSKCFLYKVSSHFLFSIPLNLFTFFNHLNSLFKSNSLRREVGALKLQAVLSQPTTRILL
ncbi:hypothetical protein [Helicobacter burdigaliensis]|uniref:hypothetical protein n=1 Tax=Helicobacter burdigaliensis TaxID=2315334 RepID=UPI00130027CB|nr:hypothetical protein [Helicobacter burdigaliensis]